MKKTFLIIFSLILVLGLTGCYSEEEVAQMKEWKNTGLELLSEHLENKYGLTDVKFEDTKVHKIDPGPIPDISPDYVPYVSTYFVVNDIKYFAAVEVEHNSLDYCYDNYEHELIVEAFEEYIQNAIGNDKYSIDLEIYDDIASEFYVYKNDDYKDGGYDLINKKFTTVEEFVKYAWDGEDNKTFINGGAYLVGLDKISISEEHKEVLSKLSDFKVINFKDFESSMYFVGSKMAKIKYHANNIIDYYQFGQYLEYMNDKHAYDYDLGYRKINVEETIDFKYWNIGEKELFPTYSDYETDRICNFYNTAPKSIVYISTQKLENIYDGQVYVVIGIKEVGFQKYKTENVDHLSKTDIVSIGNDSFVIVEFDKYSDFDYWTIIPKEDPKANTNINKNNN